MNLLIRYASVEHTKDIYADYFKSGMLEEFMPLSDKGKAEVANLKIKFNPKQIYVSPASCSVQTGEILAEKLDSDLIILDELQNIKHDLKKLVSRDEIETEQGLIKLREGFIRNLYDSKLEEDLEGIKARMLKVKNILDSSENAIFVTHGVFLVAFKLFCLNRLESFTEVGEKKLVDFTKPFYSALKGFEYPSFKIQ